MRKIILLLILGSHEVRAFAADATELKQVMLSHISLSKAAKSPLHAISYPASDVTMHLRKVSRHVYYVQGKAGTATENEGFISNAGVIITAKGVVLFDTLGTPSLGQQLLKKIRQVTHKPIVKVIISHYHADHVYGLQVFKDQGAEIIAAKGVEQYLQSDLAQRRLLERRQSLKPWVNNSTRLISPDHTIAKKTTFTLGGVRFVLTPVGKNHSPGDLILQVLSDHVMLVGDLMFEQRLPFVVGGDTGKWLHTLNTINVRHTKVIIPGHGPASLQPQYAFKDTRAYLTFLRRKMQLAVNNLIPFDEAYRIDWGQYQHLKAFDEANRQNAYSVYLSLEAESMSRN